MLLDTRHNIGIYYSFYVIGKRTLADYIEKATKGLSFERSLILTASKDLIIDLFDYHTEHIVLNNVRLEDVIVTHDDHFFILQNSKSVVVKPDQSTSQSRQTERYIGPFTIP